MRVEEFILAYQGEQREILHYLHDLLTSHLNLTPKIRYKVPFYYGKSWICYVNPTKEGDIELAFTRGSELSNEHGLLESKGRKQVASIELHDLETAPLHEIETILHEAILLDDVVPYGSKKKSK